MQVAIRMNNSASPSARYVTWNTSWSQIRLTDTTGVSGTFVDVQLSSRTAPGGTGRLQFQRLRTTALAPTLTVRLPTSGAQVPFYVGGVFGSPSTFDGDVSIVVRAGTTEILALPVMVRIRKNANALTAGERDRFLAALAQLNNQGTGRFADFRNMHVTAASPEAHGAPGFLAWHRAYLLDLERELQAIDRSVSLPYWRFDQPSPNLFTADFMGVSDALGTVSFSPTNPLQFWTTDGVQGITRRPLFNVATAAANVISEAQTLARGSTFSAFRVMEGSPHGSAHTSFGGMISSIGTAARDPLFFMLHANADRLWAKWQRNFGRFDPSVAASYDTVPSGNRIGHNLPDTMWPWNGVTGSPRPSTAPGGSLANSPCTTFPGPQPRVADMLDFQGKIAPTNRLAFDYDDVSFA